MKLDVFNNKLTTIQLKTDSELIAEKDIIFKVNGTSFV